MSPEVHTGSAPCFINKTTARELGNNALSLALFRFLEGSWNISPFSPGQNRAVQMLAFHVPNQINLLMLHKVGNHTRRALPSSASGALFSRNEAAYLVRDSIPVASLSLRINGYSTSRSLPAAIYRRDGTATRQEFFESPSRDPGKHLSLALPRRCCLAGTLCVSGNIKADQGVHLPSLPCLL